MIFSFIGCPLQCPQDLTDSRRDVFENEPTASCNIKLLSPSLPTPSLSFLHSLHPSSNIAVTATTATLRATIAATGPTIVEVTSLSSAPGNTDLPSSSCYMPGIDGTKKPASC